MDYNKLYSLSKEKLFTDLELTLIDEFNEITINVHKYILYSSCIYFEKLLTNFKEANSNLITIEVPNAYVSYDIIMGFYQQKTNLANYPPFCGQDYPKWRHLLESIKCLDFFGLKLDQEKITDIEVPAEGFELLLEVIEIIGYNDFTIKTLIKNFPQEYDLSKLSKKLLSKIYEMIKCIISVGGNGIQIWDIENKQLIDYNASGGMSYTSNNNRIALTKNRIDIEIWNLETKELIHVLKGHTDNIQSMCYSPNAKYIVSGSRDCHIKIWDTETGKLMHNLYHNEWIYSVCYSPNNKQIASGSRDSILINNAETGQLIYKFIHNDTIDSVCYSPDNKQLASGNYKGSIKIWDMETGQLIRILHGHTHVINSICYSSDNKQIASGSGDHSIKIWNAETGQLIHTLNGHTRSIYNSICYSLDNKQIASGSCDHSIKIWDAETGRLIRTLNNASYVYGIWYAPKFASELEKKIEQLIY
jgi:WD40 repeat protein